MLSLMINMICTKMLFKIGERGYCNSGIFFFRRSYFKLTFSYDDFFLKNNFPVSKIALPNRRILWCLIQSSIYCYASLDLTFYENITSLIRILEPRFWRLVRKSFGVRIWEEPLKEKFVITNVRVRVSFSSNNLPTITSQFLTALVTSYAHRISEKQRPPIMKTINLGTFFRVCCALSLCQCPYRALKQNWS